MENYSIVISKKINSVKELFSIYTESCYLGESGIDNWDWFHDLIYTRLAYSDIKIHVLHKLKMEIDKNNLQIYIRLMKQLMDEFPEKLNVDFSNI